MEKPAELRGGVGFGEELGRDKERSRAGARGSRSGRQRGGGESGEGWEEDKVSRFLEKCGFGLENRLTG